MQIGLALSEVSVLDWSAGTINYSTLFYGLPFQMTFFINLMIDLFYVFIISMKSLNCCTPNWMCVCLSVFPQRLNDNTQVRKHTRVVLNNFQRLDYYADNSYIHHSILNIFYSNESQDCLQLETMQHYQPCHYRLIYWQSTEYRHIESLTHQLPVSISNVILPWRFTANDYCSGPMKSFLFQNTAYSMHNSVCLGTNQELICPIKISAGLKMLKCLTGD